MRTAALSACLIVAALGGEVVAAEKSAWIYRKDADPMTGAVSAYAVLTSSNIQQLGFPYQGGTRAKLYIRQTAGAQPDFMLELNRGQFLCPGEAYCSVLVKFDLEEPQDYGGSRSDDGSSNVLFIRSESLLAERLPAAQRMKVEVLIYQEGRRVFDFDIRGLKWPLPGASKTQTGEKPSR